eukprot:5944518-Prymnesium_polylepis.2
MLSSLVMTSVFRAGSRGTAVASIEHETAELAGAKRPGRTRPAAMRPEIDSSAIEEPVRKLCKNRSLAKGNYGLWQRRSKVHSTCSDLLYFAERRFRVRARRTAHVGDRVRLCSSF